MKEKKKLTAVYQLYAGGAIVYLILAVIAAKVMIPSSYQLVLNYWTSNPLLSQTSTIFAPAAHVLWNIEFRWLVVLIMGLSLISPAYYVCLISNNVKKINLVKYRFIDWTITSSLILLVVLTLAGVQDLMTLLALMALNAISYGLFWLTNGNFDIKKQYLKILYVMGIICNLLPLLLIAVYAISTLVYGNVRSPGFVYLLYVVAILSSAVPIYGYYWHRLRRASKSLISNETYPILANQFIKIAFAIILIIGLKR